jgi:hypothetical protein
VVGRPRRGRCRDEGPKFDQGVKCWGQRGLLVTLSVSWLKDVKAKEGVHVLTGLEVGLAQGC